MQLTRAPQYAQRAATKEGQIAAAAPRRLGRITDENVAEDRPLLSLVLPGGRIGFAGLSAGDDGNTCDQKRLATTRQ